MVEIPSAGWTLHGIVHVPAERKGRRVGVIIVQGPNTKFGTHRLYPQVAEALTEAGFWVLRYDNRGTCDSPGVCKLTFADRVADARAAAAYLRREYRLDAVLGWGLCMGGAVGVHCAAALDGGKEQFEGLMLVNILAYPGLAAVPQRPTVDLNAQKVARNIFRHENPARKAWKILTSRENWVHKGPALVRRYLRLEPELNELRKEISKVGELLVRYAGPMLLLFGEKDRYWVSFRDEVNVNDKLGLSRKKSQSGLAVVKDGDHTFSSPELMAELLRHTKNWAQPFLEGRLPGRAQTQAAGCASTAETQASDAAAR